MSEEAKHKCTVRDGKFVEPCDTLDGMITTHAAYAARGSTFFHCTLTNIQTGEPSRSFVGYRSTKHPKGLLLNCCPWCCERIDAPFEDPALCGPPSP